MCVKIYAIKFSHVMMFNCCHRILGDCTFFIEKILVVITVKSNKYILNTAICLIYNWIKHNHILFYVEVLVNIHYDNSGRDGLNRTVSMFYYQ